MSFDNTLSTANGETFVGREERSDCRICSNIIREGRGKIEPWDETLVETEEFSCTPTVGSLVEGYLITMPKNHVLCSGDLSIDSLKRYWEFTISVSNQVEKEYGDTIIFEHGPAKPNTRVGCGVDHAHMHIVPIQGPIMEYADNINKEPINWEALSSIEKLQKIHRAGNEYILIQDGKSQPLIGTSSTIRSQLFRRVIAHILDIPEKYDWKEYSFQDNVEKTIDKLDDGMRSDNVHLQS